VHPGRHTSKEFVQVSASAEAMPKPRKQMMAIANILAMDGLRLTELQDSSTKPFSGNAGTDFPQKMRSTNRKLERVSEST
jgi:hypothetical protein